MILQALVNSADKNSDGGMDWQEFEGFGDFDLAFRTRRLMTAVLNDDILDDMKNCNGDQKCLPTLWTMEEYFKLDFLLLYPREQGTPYTKDVVGLFTLG